MVEIVGRSIESDRQVLEGVLERDVAKLENVQPPFPRLLYDDAVALLKRRARRRSNGGATSAAPTRR